MNSEKAIAILTFDDQPEPYRIVPRQNPEKVAAFNDRFGKRAISKRAQRRQRGKGKTHV